MARKAKTATETILETFSTMPPDKQADTMALLNTWLKVNAPPIAVTVGRPRKPKPAPVEMEKAG